MTCSYAYNLRRQKKRAQQEYDELPALDRYEWVMPWWERVCAFVLLRRPRQSLRFRKAA